MVVSCSKCARQWVGAINEQCPWCEIDRQRVQIERLQAEIAIERQVSTDMGKLCERYYRERNAARDEIGRLRTELDKRTAAAT